jgi:hypothetical protein
MSAQNATSEYMALCRRISWDESLSPEGIQNGKKQFYDWFDRLANEGKIIKRGAKSRADVDSIAAIAAPVDAHNIEGPMDYAPGYDAVFFEDPTGNRLKLRHRLRPQEKFG